MANFIPPEFIAELNRRLDIVELVSQYVILRKQGRNFVGLCPFHTEDTPSFIVSPDKQIYHCFGCHSGGNGINFLMSIENLSFPEAIEKLATACGMDLPKQDLNPLEKEKIAERQTYYKINNLAMEFYQDQLWSKEGEEARVYLEQRGLKPETVKKFLLGYAPNTWDSLLKFLLGKGYNHKQINAAGLITQKETKAYDRFRQRLIFPIQDFKGQVIAFGGRILGDGQPKYLNSPETPLFHKSQQLYGLFLAGSQIRKQDQAVIMEGYLDVITAHQFGIETAIASLGTALTKEHATLLRRYTNHSILAYDGDSAGIHAANKGMDVLKEQGATISILEFPQQLDPDEFLRKHTRVGWDQLLAEKLTDYWDYKLSYALKTNDISTITGKGALVNQLLPFIGACQNQVERDSFVNLVAKTIGISPDAIYSDLRKFGDRSRTLGSVPKSAVQPKLQGNEPTKALNKKEANLVLFILYSQEVYKETKKSLGFSFTEHPALQELLTLIQKIKDEYNWQPSTLFSYLQEGETKQLLLRMLSLDIEQDKIFNLALGCIQGIQIEHLQVKVFAKEAQLKTVTKLADSKGLLAEIMNLQQEIRNLRAT